MYKYFNKNELYGYYFICFILFYLFLGKARKVFYFLGSSNERSLETFHLGYSHRPQSPTSSPLMGHRSFGEINVFLIIFFTDIFLRVIISR